MSQKESITIITILLVVILAGTGIYFGLNWKTSSTPVSTPTPAPPSPTPSPTPVPTPIPPPMPTPKPPVPGLITVRGEITCLPKKGGDQQTMECAIGLKGFDGQYYGLKNLSKFDPDYKFSVGGLRVEVSGVFSPEEIKGPDGNTYDVIGTIDVTSIKELNEVSKSGCMVSGCNGEICAEQEFVSICEARPEHACYKTARCERQANGRCGWTMTEGLNSCLNKFMK